MSIEVKHLTHTYSQGSAFQATAIEDVNLTISEGEFIGVIGHTGSGKSTLVQHLNGLLTPTSGQILVDGEDMFAKGVDRRHIRQKVGLVFQYPEYQLFEETVAKDIAFGPKNLGLSAEEITRRVVSQTASGSILLFHNDAQHTPEALPQIIEQLKAKGYRFLTASEMIYRDGYTLNHEGRQIADSAG